MATNPQRYHPAKTGVIGAASTVTRGTFALDSAYVHGSANDAIAFRFMLPGVAGGSTTLTDWFGFVTAFSGTPGALDVNLCDATSATQPGTIAATANVTPTAAANKWIKATWGSPPAINYNTMYFVVVGDPAGSGSNFVTLMTNAAGPYTSELLTAAYIFRAYTSTAGFSGSGTATNGGGGCVLKFADGQYLGCPYTTTGSYTSNQRERGLYITGLSEQLQLFGVNASALTSVAAYKGYQAPTAPGGALAAWFNGAAAFSLSAAAIAANSFVHPLIVVPKATAARLVFTFSANSIAPNYYQIEDTGTYGTDLYAASFFGGRIYSTIDNGAGGWTEEPDKLPRMIALIDDHPEVAASGGGLIVHPGMSGGFRG